MSDALRKAQILWENGEELYCRALVAADVCRLGRSMGGEPVLVGGLCADLWTAGALAKAAPDVRPRLTQEIDMVSAGAFRPQDTAALRRALAQAGYRMRGRGPPEECRDWAAPGIPVLVQVLESQPWPEDRSVVIEVDGESLRLWDPETTFWQYCENAWSQGSTRDDWIRARAMAAAQPDMDWPRVRRTAGDLAWLVDAARAQRPIEDVLNGPPRT